ncbi:hypothetical protein CMO89_03590 [Candidatus Woesearchaeota archaeon]|nr:hypothetical protein [Candidatus Woesearchaeota archaeon]|tara:strand:+ start:5170 stop:5826 length:657 start_codon:yes stop_codon:yes gene_type:complete
MIWFLRKKTSEKRLRDMNNRLISSFSGVKQDITNINMWLNYLYQKNTAIENSIKTLENKFNEIPRNTDAGRLIKLYSSFNDIQAQIMNLKSKVDTLPATDSSVIDKIGSVMSRVDNISLRIDNIEGKDAGKKNNLKKAILKDISKKSKDYIKNLIFRMIKKYDKITASQLKKMIVEEQSLCSKSTFYRLLLELEQSNSIGAANSGKEKQFYYKLSKQT